MREAGSAHTESRDICRNAPIQEEMGETDAIGAAVASTRYASFSRLISIRSMIGRNVLPTIRLFA